MMKRVVQAGVAALAVAAAAPAFAQQRETCGVFVASGDTTSYIPIQGFTILGIIPPIGMPPGQTRIDGVVCDRAGIFLGPSDHRVLTDLAVPLYIRHDGRVAVLEAPAGRLQVRMSTGGLRDGEQQALAEALDRAETALAAPAR